VTIEVRLFANLARYLPPGAQGDGARLDVQDDATVGDVVRRLAIPADLPGLLLVNGVEASPDRRLRSGDVLSIVPPLAGG
jgi:molybdopterin converting factor small subunit